MLIEKKVLNKSLMESVSLQTPLIEVGTELFAYLHF